MAMPPEIRVDVEFEAICRPLTDEEFQGLRSDIAERGCIDPIIVWQQEGVILDGHNRHRICRELGFPFPVKEIPFGDRHRAWIWTIDHQLHRRNLTPRERTYMIGMRLIEERRTKEQNLVPGAVHHEAGERVGNRDAGSDPSSGHFDHSKEKTRDRVATETGVSPSKVQRAARFAGAVNVLADAGGKDVRRAILSGEIPLTERDVEDLAEHPEAIRGLEDLRAAAEERKARRRPRPSTTDQDRPFIQHAIVEESIVTTQDPEDGTELLESATLTCGHEYRWKRPVVAGTTLPQSVPCTECGSGTRRPVDERRARARLDAAIDRAWAEPERREELRAFLRTYAVARTLRPGDARRAKLEEEMDRHFTLAVDVEAA